MKTTDKRYQDMIDRHSAERADMEAELRLAAHLPEDVRHVHVRDGKRGVIGAASFGDNYIAEGGRVTSGGGPVSWERACEIALALPAIERSKAKGGSLSFPPRAWMESQKEDPMREEMEVSPVIAKLDYQHLPDGRGFAPRLTLEWYTATPEGVIEVAVHVGSVPLAICEMLQKTKRAGEKAPVHVFMAWKRGDEIGLRLSNAMMTIFDGPSALAKHETPIRWSSGGPEYPSTFTMYWTDTDAWDAARVARCQVAQMARLATAGKDPAPIE